LGVQEAKGHNGGDSRQQRGGETETKAKTMKNAGHRKPLVVTLGIPRVKQGNRVQPR
jgi:hypothetical protein